MKEDILRFLQNSRIEHEVFEHQAVHTCAEMANALKASLSEIAKCMMFRTSKGKFVLVVLPGDEKVDQEKLASVVGSSVEMASDEDVREIAGCSPGCIHPFGNLMGIEVYFDPTLLEKERIYFNPASHTLSVRVSPRDLVKLINPGIEELRKVRTVREREEKELGITARKDENFSEWYIQVVLKSGLADRAPIKGFMVLMPFGYAIWQRIVDFLDKRFRQTGHRNAYFPALIPEDFLKKEAEHFEGFVPEVFWVTHAGDRKLGERAAIRPTSETIIYASYARWVRSWRDLPILLNQWNSVLRAEIKATKPFIRTSEFLWQEGHTVHASKEEADEEVMRMLHIYKELVEDVLAIPVLVGKKSELEKFAGAEYTATLEALMPDGRAIQMATSHQLGQRFAKAFGIQFLDKDGKKKYAWQTCWGFSWRPIGAMVMMHGDDKGLVLPPKVAPHRVVIIPIYYSNEERELVLRKAREIGDKLSDFDPILDDRPEYTPGWKFHEWELKGIPLRIEIGPRDVETGQVMVVRRDSSEKKSLKEAELVSSLKSMLDEIQAELFQRAREFLQSRTAEVRDYDEFKRVIRKGFAKACWCGNARCEQRIKEETGATIRTIPFEKEKVFAPCVRCGEEAKEVVYFARAY